MLIFADALVHYEETHTHRNIKTAGIWATYPQEHVHNITGFFDQVMFFMVQDMNCEV